MKHIQQKFPHFERRTVLLVGPNQSGKSALIRKLLNLPIDDKYEGDVVG
jgi:ABC-type Mn2+/Zn2+ transport system ATPase subunit